jgi:hypothetical protein
VAKSISYLHPGMKSQSSEDDSYATQTNSFITPQTYLCIACACGKEHKINLDELPQTSSEKIQIKEKCEYARHYIVHSGQNGYRKVLIVSKYGD